MNTKLKMRLLSILLCFVMLVGLMPTTAFAASEIHQANITITKPVGGENPDIYPVSSEPDKYFVDLDSWAWLTAGSATPIGAGSQFKALERYSLRVLFRAKLGYTFADDCVYTINGETTGCYGLDADEFRYIYWYAADPQNPTYTVSFDSDGGTGTMADVTGIFDKYVLPPSTFTAPAGKYFAGWFVGGYVKDPGESITVLSNTTVYANWKNIPAPGYGYSVTYDGGNECGGSMAAQNKTDFYGELTLPECGFPPPAGKRFAYWQVGNSSWNPSDKIIITFDTTVNAIWEDIPQQPTTYTVAFDSNGGTGTMAAANGISGNYTLPANGFTPPANKQFKCWAVGAQNDEYDPGDKITITANVTVKAVWEAITSSRQVISDVVVNSSDLDTIPTLYGLLKVPTFTVTQGAPAYINASTSNLRWQKKVGGVWTNQDSGRFTPGEWRISSSLRIDTPGAYHYELGNPTTLKVNGVEWTVDNGGKPSVHPDYSYASIYSPEFTIVDDPNVQPPVSVPIVHMVLKGYEKGALISAASVQTDAMVDADVLGFLKLVDSNGDGVPEPEVAGNNDVFEEGVLYAVAISLHAKDGYDISGLTPATVSLDRSLMDSVEEFVEDDETFSGIYILDDMNQWTVKFETNGGSSIAPKKVSNGKTATPPADPTRAYYAFAGWYSDSNLTQAFDFNTPISTDTTLYAKWTPSPVGGMFLMTIDFNGGISTMPSSGEVPVGSEVYFETGQTIQSVVTPPSGKVFDAYEIDGVRYEHGDEYYVTQNFTLKFLWKDAPVTTYTVSFNANGGTGTMADVTGISGEYTLPENSFTAPDGKQFKAWSVGGVEKAVGDKITVTADTTVTAVWETIPAGHTCDIKPVAKVEPSCTEGGKEAYYKCEGCGKFYEDALGAKEITDLAAWGNIAKNGHTESDWKSDKDNHWKECTVAACGVIIENSKAAHADANNDGKCDTCEYNVGTTTTNPNNKPSDDVQSPQTGDNSMMWLWVALLFVSGFGVVATTVIGKKKSSAK